MYNGKHYTKRRRFMNNRLKLVSTIDTKEPGKAHDEYCKKILAFKSILASIMHDQIPEYMGMPIPEIEACIEPIKGMEYIKRNGELLGLNLEDIAVIGAEIRYDVFFFAKLPTKKVEAKKEIIGFLINMEAHGDDERHYPLISRGVYHACRILAGQKNAKYGFQHTNYLDIKKVYSLWICMNHIKEKDDVVNSYKLTETCLRKEWHSPVSHYDLIEVIMIYLKKSYDDYNDGEYDSMKLLNVLFNSNLPLDEIKRQLIENYGILVSEDLEQEVAEMCNLSEGIRKEAKAEERFLSAVEHVKNLMETGNIEINKALDMLKISEDIRQAVIDEIEKKN